MGRLVLVLIVGIAALLYFDDSRQMVIDHSAPVLDPIREWQTRSELDEVADRLSGWQRENFGRLPDRRDWQDWLDRNLQVDGGQDSWGSTYFYQNRADSFFIISSGRDGLYGTEDDLQVGRRKMGAGDGR